jgi:PAS domain S-box-containing protein
MIRQNFGKGIQYKFLKDISIILFISTCVLSTVIAINEGRMLKRSLMTKGLSFATYIAELSQDPLIMKDSIQLDSIVNEANKDEDIIYAIIRNAQGSIITSQYASINYRSPRLKEILSRLPKDSDFTDAISVINKKVTSAEVSVRIFSADDHIGTVTICMSEINIRKQIVQTVLFVIALNLLVAFALGSVLFITSRKTILDPIVELSRAAARLAKGDLSTQAKTVSIGEIQMLVDSFNRMAGDLKKTTVSKDYVDNIINSMTDALIVISSDGTILLANHSACTLLGYECSELIGRPFDMVLVEQFPAKQMVDDIRKGTSVRNIEITYVTKMGETVPMLF